jgi:peptidoglycan/xylan/chitin deacetylase (PgdA/CDA1 family)
VKEPILETPDGRYIIVRGRLWRKSNPHLPEHEQKRLVSELMAARRAVKEATGNPEQLRAARKAVDAVKVALGERGPVWWNDGAPDFNRHLAKNTPYGDRMNATLCSSSPE